MKETYDVTIKKVLNKKVTVRAESQAEAIRMVKTICDLEPSVLPNDDLSQYPFIFECEGMEVNKP